MDTASTQKSSSLPLLLGVTFDIRIPKFIVFDFFFFTILGVFVIRLLKVEDGKG
jgi:hypothetical protein